MKNVMQNILNAINVNSNDNVVVGVSGGADSVVLLHALLEKRKSVPFNLLAVHVNHHLRGKESDRDQEFVRTLCNNLGVECYFADVDVKNNKKENKLTEEESARNLRYKVFDKIIKEKNIDKFFVAHHANDQAETVLMHIFRGSGMAGACGMVENGKYYRPLLFVTKKEILDLACEQKFDYIEDSTNKQNICNRNILRNKILPEIEKIYPGASKNICKFASILQEDQNYIDSIIDYCVVKINGNKATIPLSSLDSCSVSVRLIKHAINLLGVYSDVLGKHFSAVLKLADKKNGAKIDLPSKLIAAKEYNNLAIYKLESEKQEQQANFEMGTFKIAGNVIDVQMVDSVENFVPGNNYLDLDKVPAGAVLRSPQPGDKFAKLGSKGEKKLVDYFTDKKIPLQERKKVIVLASGNECLAVVGFDTSEKVKICEKTKQIVCITCLTKYL